MIQYTTAAALWQEKSKKACGKNLVYGGDKQRAVW